MIQSKIPIITKPTQKGKIAGVSGSNLLINTELGFLFLAITSLGLYVESENKETSVMLVNNDDYINANKASCSYCESSKKQTALKIKNATTFAMLAPEYNKRIAYEEVEKGRFKVWLSETGEYNLDLDSNGSVVLVKDTAFLSAKAKASKTTSKNTTEG